MKRDKNRRKTIVNFLTDPDPTYVAFVRRGANQRPFHAIKSAGGVTSPTKETDQMKNRLKKTKAAAGVVIQRITFDKAHFADQAAVEGYLTEKGYSDFEIHEEGTTFYVDDSADEIAEGTERDIESQTVKGVSYRVGDAKAAAGAGADDPGEGAGTGEEASEDKGSEAGNVTEDDKPEDKPEDKPADPPVKEDPPAVGDDQQNVSQKAAVPETRTRTRKAQFLVGGLTPAALAANHESLAAFLEERQVTSKTFADTVAEYTGGVAPGLWSLSEALMTELRKALKSGRADEAFVQDLSTKFARGVMVMSGAYESIINETVAAAKAAGLDDADIDVVLDHMFGALPGAKTDAPVPVQPADVEAAVAKAMKAEMPALVQRAIADIIAVSAYEGGDDEEDDDGKSNIRVLPGRKSADVVEDNPNDTGAEAEAEAEEEENRRRAMKRLGLN